MRCVSVVGAGVAGLCAAFAAAKAGARVKVHEVGDLGTKGGPKTDAAGRVLSISGGSPIAGLYAAGNAAASPFGLAYPGAGGTIGPAVVFGLRAGEAAAGD